MDDEWTRGGHRATPHVHPRMEERWELVAGRASFRIGDEPARTLAPGESIVAPAGVAHVAWSEGTEPVRLRIEMRPALRWAEVVERLFALARDGRGDDAFALRELLAAYPDELAPPPRGW